MIESQDYPEKSLRINVVRGTLSIDEAVATLTTFYAGDPTLNVLWDFTETDSSSVVSQDIERVVEAVSGLQHSRSGGRTALVAPRDAEFGFSRMFQILGELSDLDFEIGSFRSRGEALEWLESG